eukprot:5139538-Amphidinium_carterae.1
MMMLSRFDPGTASDLNFFGSFPPKAPRVHFSRCWTVLERVTAWSFGFSHLICGLVPCNRDWSSGERDYLPVGHYWVALCGAKWLGPDPEEWMRCALLPRSYCISQAA